MRGEEERKTLLIFVQNGGKERKSIMEQDNIHLNSLGLRASNIIHP
jgi:hypothetical protein